MQPIGNTQSGDLSTANVIVTATDSAGHIISQANQTNYPTNSTAYDLLQLSLPVTLGQQYYLSVQNTAAAGGPTAFYFIDHYLNPLLDQAQVTGNISFATAQALTAQGTSNISPSTETSPRQARSTGTRFRCRRASPSTRSSATLRAPAQGLTGFAIALYDAASAATATLGTPFGTATEDPVTGINTAAANLPSTATAGSKVYLTAKAAGQSSTVVGTQYRCFVFFE